MTGVGPVATPPDSTGRRTKLHREASYDHWWADAENSRQTATWGIMLGQRKLVLELPEWIDSHIDEPRRNFDSIDARMRWVLALAKANVEHGTGGPFGAAVFDAGTGQVIGVGVNLVETAHCSIAHAEMMAIAIAQQRAGHYDLGSGGAVCELVTSTEPCAMCLGAIPWSGVRRVVCGARGQDACAIGFDEGAKPSDWVAALRERGITVVRDVLRAEAQAVLRQYAEAGGLIYNARNR
jgi:tRNA(Arg) A34 adenosine deaminase TadA